MRFRIDVNTLDGKMSYERDTPDDTIAFRPDRQHATAYGSALKG